jgi:LPXTG-site transpeptidase (sortase) family protein
LNKAVCLLLGLSAALLVAAALTFAASYGDGVKAGHEAQALLTQYESPRETGPVTSGPGPTDPTPAPPDETQAGLSSGGTKRIADFDGYSVVGTLQIDSLGIELPVISETSVAGLKASVCYYQGAIPPEKGCMVITGHNYASGAHFGKLDKIKMGDTVVFTATNGVTYTYKVAGLRIVKPDQTEALDDCNGGLSLALVTCVNNGNARLIASCVGVSTN